MSTDALVWPIVVQVVMTFAIMLRMAYERFTTGAREGIRAQRVATRAEMAALMPNTCRSSDNFQNQFETPVLFLAAMLLAIQFDLATPTLVGLAWAWVVLRHIHAAIHLSYNKVRHRYRAFLASVIALVAIWIDIAYQIAIR
jgi:hypothetical protein